MSGFPRRAACRQLCPSICASVSSQPSRRARLVVRRPSGSASARPARSAGTIPSGRRAGSHPSCRAGITARPPSRRMPIGSWRCAKRIRQSSCGSCATLWPSRISEPARAACGASSPGAASTNRARRSGRAPRGERCRIAGPHGPSKTTTVTAALRATGLAATALLDGATNGTRLRAYVRDTLVPVLKRGDTLILDNLPAPKVAGVREAIEAAGAQLLYLPPYSPDFNPIEQAFAKLKALLRSAIARTVPDLWTAIRHAFTAFSPGECRNYLTAAGYDAYDPT